MSRRNLMRIPAIAVVLVAAGVAAPASAATPAAAAPFVRTIQLAGTVANQPRPAGSGDLAALNTEIPKAFGPEAHEGADAAAPALTAPSAKGAGVNRSMVRRPGALAASPAPLSSPPACPSAS